MFGYSDRILHADRVSLATIAESAGTPFYAYSADIMTGLAREFANAFQGSGIATYFAIKANSNIAVVNLFARHGFGADIVSGGELKRALAAGIPASKIVFSGVGKSVAEMTDAMQAGIHRFNIESKAELLRLMETSDRIGARCYASLRINPDVDAGGHDKISTGRSHDKFGVPVEDAASLFALAAGSRVNLNGLTVHIGSQILETQPFRQAYIKLADAMASLESEGFRIESLDLGGGFGVRYVEDDHPSTVEEFAETVRSVFAGFKGEIGIEPGRALVANAGVLVTRVLYVKHAYGRRIVVVDAAMNDLIRPTLYDAVHRIIPVAQNMGTSPATPCDIVGPVCESGDTFAIDRELPDVQAGDLLAILSAGAYGATMSSTYNTRPLIPEIMVSDDRWDIIRRRFSAEEQISLETIPQWLAA
jgi:diaminopimelate decarboxylase